MANFTTLANAIVAVLQTVQVDGGAAFADIKTYPTTQFTGTPAVAVFESHNDSDYQTIVSNLRTYGYQCDLFIPYQTEGDGPQVAYTQMRKLAGACLDAFDQSNTLNGACEILVPTPSVWEPVETDTGVFLWARISLQAKMTTTTNNG